MAMNWKIVKRAQDRGVVAHGMKRLEGAMQKAGIAYERVPAWTGGLQPGVLFVGLGSDAYIDRLTDACPAEKESICLASVGSSRVAAGSDERGLAYALYELAERIEDAGESALTELVETVGSPSQRIRGVDRFISHSGDERWWMNRQYWIDYFEHMVSSRFNRLTLLMGFDTGYLSPPYPFFVEVPGYENIRIEGLTVPPTSRWSTSRRCARSGSCATSMDAISRSPSGSRRLFARDRIRWWSALRTMTS